MSQENKIGKGKLTICLLLSRKLSNNIEIWISLLFPISLPPIKFLHIKAPQSVSYFNTQVANRKCVCHKGNYGQNKEEECKWGTNDYFIKIPRGSFCLRLDTMSD